jgi:SAM-dependent methyltransferase
MADSRQRALLHRHGGAGTWGNLGLWPAPDYAGAARALAERVGRAAALGPGQRVLSIACGAGDELALWVEAFGVAHALGSDPDPAARALAARFAGPRVAVADVDAGSASDLAPGAAPDPDAARDTESGRDTGSGPRRRFDAVLCVDAAYHLAPRRDFLARAFAALRPGGRLAFTDLVLDGGRSLPLRAAARLCGVPAGDLAGVDARLAQLRAAGFVDLRCERLDAAVLDGFAAFVRTQRQRLGADAAGPGWRRVAVTAALIPPCRALGLGYALFSARRPRR